MAERYRRTMAQNKTFVAEQIWLHYYNDYLFVKGMISEQERNRMKFTTSIGTSSTTSMPRWSV